jgi:hypothetical protein
MGRLNRILSQSFIDTNAFEPGKLYLLDIADLEYSDYISEDVESERIILSIIDFIKKSHVMHRIVFTYVLESLQVVAGVYWVLAAKRLGIKKVRGWYADTDTLVYGDDYIMERDELISLELAETM